MNTISRASAALPFSAVTLGTATAQVEQATASIARLPAGTVLIGAIAAREAAGLIRVETDHGALVLKTAVSFAEGETLKIQLVGNDARAALLSSVPAAAPTTGSPQGTTIAQVTTTEGVDRPAPTPEPPAQADAPIPRESSLPPRARGETLVPGAVVTARLHLTVPAPSPNQSSIGNGVGQSVAAPPPQPVEAVATRAYSGSAATAAPPHSPSLTLRVLDIRPPPGAQSAETVPRSTFKAVGATTIRANAQPAAITPGGPPIPERLAPPVTSASVDGTVPPERPMRDTSSTAPRPVLSSSPSHPPPANAAMPTANPAHPTSNRAVSTQPSSRSLATPNPEQAPPTFTRAPSPASPPPNAVIVTGTAVPPPAAGLLALRSPLGLLTVVTGHFLPVGSLVTFEVVGVAPANDTAPGGAPQASALELTRDWPALRETLNVLHSNDPNLFARLAESVLPQPGTRLASAMLFFISALHQGNVASWLGERIDAELARAGMGNLANNLVEDFRQLARTVDEGGPGAWRTYLIPVMEGGEPRQIRFFHRNLGQNDGDGNARERDSRFLVDIDLSRLGAMQLDGLLQGRRFTLVLRTATLLESKARHQLSEIFRDGCECAGLTGEIGFGGADGFVPLPLEPPRGDGLTA